MPVLNTNASAHSRALLLAVCRQRGSKAEGLVQQPVLQGVDSGVEHRHSVHATRHHFQSIGSSQGAVSFITYFG